MPRQSDVDLVLADLEDALQALNNAVSSPKLVRQAFSRFIDLSQRLTSVMRKDWSKRQRGPWKASTFEGWNNTSSLFKELRNQEQHELQVYISIHETRCYEPFGPGGGQIAHFGTWKLTDQSAASPPDWMKLYESDPHTGEMLDVEILPYEVTYQYLIQPRDEVIASLLQDIGTSDLHQLSADCMAILRQYHTFYCSKYDE